MPDASTQLADNLELTMASFIPLRDRPSAWTFGGSSSFGASVSYAAGEAGHIHLNDPSGTDIGFWYAMLGGGVSEGLVKIPFKLGFSAAPAFVYNTGKVYITRSFGDGELTRDDLTGMFIARELSAAMGVWGAGSATIILAGIKSIASKVDTAIHYLYPQFNTWRDIYDLVFGDDPIDEVFGIGANAVIVMAGVSLATAGAAGTQYVGWLR